MKQIEPGIYYEDGYPGVTLGALAFPHGIIMIDAPLRAEDARAWRSALHNLPGGPNRKTAQVFRNRPSIFKGQNGESGAEWEVSNDVLGNRWAVPDITFAHRIFFQWGGPQVTFEHHPGPALGSIWAIIPDAHIVCCSCPPIRITPSSAAAADRWTARRLRSS
jgi:hypothetical protein